MTEYIIYLTLKLNKLPTRAPIFRQNVVITSLLTSVDHMPFKCIVAGSNKIFCNCNLYKQYGVTHFILTPPRF